MVLISTIAEIGSSCTCILEQQIILVSVGKYCRTIPRDTLGMLYRQQRRLHRVSITRTSTIVGKGCTIFVADVVSNMHGHRQVMTLSWESIPHVVCTVSVG